MLTYIHFTQELKGDIKLKFDRNSPEVSSNQFIPEHSYHLDDDDEDIDRNAVFEELKKWRENFEKYEIHFIL